MTIHSHSVSYQGTIVSYQGTIVSCPGFNMSVPVSPLFIYMSVRQQHCEQACVLTIKISVIYKNKHPYIIISYFHRNIFNTIFLGS